MSKPILLTLTCSDTYDEIYNDHERLHRAYCQDWGYELVKDRLEPGETFKWEKQLYIAKLLSRETPPPFIAFLDADAFIAHPGIDLQEALPEDLWLGLVAHPLGLYGQEIHLCVGVQFWRPHVDALRFIHAVDSRKANAENEQQVMNHLLFKDREWQKGFCLLGNEWNLNWNQFKVADPIVVGWHGFDKGDDKERRRQMIARMRLCGLPVGRTS